MYLRIWSWGNGYKACFFKGGHGSIVIPTIRCHHAHDDNNDDDDDTHDNTLHHHDHHWTISSVWWQRRWLGLQLGWLWLGVSSSADHCNPLSRWLWWHENDDVDVPNHQHHHHDNHNDDWPWLTIVQNNLNLFLKN